jgi:hypothetical protein
MKNAQELLKPQDSTGWLKECIEVSRRIKDALVRNDLAALESCLDRGETLSSRRPKPTATDLAAARELLSLNDINRTLIDNGFNLARTLLDVIHPPATYSGLAAGVTPASPNEPQISVEC